MTSIDPALTAALPAFVPAVRVPPDVVGEGTWFAFRGDQLLVRDDAAGASLPTWAELEALGARHEQGHYLGRLGQADCFAVDLDPTTEPAGGLAFQGLRALFGRLPDPHFGLAGRAVQIVHWDRTHRFCGRCGAPTERMHTERAMRCPRCDLLAYPRLSPAVIVLVERGGEILLGRNRAFPGAFYSALAGFVEPGETLEEAVAREVREEVGIEIAGLRYFGSQPWPFPHQLMIGFTARYASGELRPDSEELLDAQWFRPEALPSLPSPMSIARRLIDAAIAARQAGGHSTPARRQLR